MANIIFDLDQQKVANVDPNFRCRTFFQCRADAPAGTLVRQFQLKYIIVSRLDDSKTQKQIGSRHYDNNRSGTGNTGHLWSGTGNRRSWQQEFDRVVSVK